MSFEPVLEPNAGGRPVARLRDVHEDLVAARRGREATQLVRELVDRPARLEVEARGASGTRIPSHIPRCSGKPMCGRRLSTACTSSPSVKRQTTCRSWWTTSLPASRSSASEATGTKRSAATSVTVMLAR
jgi:hypothetical protein